MSITVYTKPACQACRMTYRVLDKAGLDYDVVDVTESDEAMRVVAEMGYQALPVVVAGDDHWSGLRVDRLKALAER